MNDVPRCQHVKVNGTQCGSPALRRKRFCYFHDNYRQTQARLLEGESMVLLGNLPLLEDANSVQVAVMQVIHLLASGKMDVKVAGLTLYALQTAAINLKRVNFEAEKVTDIVIDQDALDLTCINGPQWFDRDFHETAETTSGETKAAPKTSAETASGEKTEALVVAKPATKEEEEEDKNKNEDPQAVDRATMRKKPRPEDDKSPPGYRLAETLLRRLGVPTEPPPEGEPPRRRERPPILANRRGPTGHPA